MPHVVGREPEKRAIASMVSAAREGSLRVVGIEGPPGIGKSALLEHTVAGLEGWTVLRCHLDPSRSTTRLSAMAELLEPLGWTEADASPEPSATARRLRERFEDEGHPVCLAVEDAHWLDDASNDVILQLARQMRDLPLLVLVTMRPQPLPIAERFPRLAHEPNRGRWIELGPLGADGVGELLSRTLAVAPDLPTLNRIIDVTGGYPIHVEELAHRLGASDDPNHTLTTTLAEFRGAAPDRMLTERIRSQLTDATPQTRAALLALSLSDELTWDQVCAATEERGLPAPMLSEVMDSELVVRTPRETLRPRHAMVAGAVVAEVAPDEVGQTHVALGRVLEGTPSLQHRVRAARTLEDDPGLVAELEHRSLEHLLLGDPELSFDLACDAAHLDPSRTLNAAITAMRVRRLDLAVALERPVALETRPLQQKTLRALLAAAHQDRQSAHDLVASIDPASCDDETLTVLAYAAHEFGRLSVAQGHYAAASTTLAIHDELIARRARAIEGGAAPEFMGEFSNLIGLLQMWWVIASLDPRDGPPVIADMLALEAELEQWPRTDTTLSVVRSIRCAFQFYSGFYDEGATGLTTMTNPPVDADFILQLTYTRFQMLFQAGRWDEALLTARQALGRTMDRLNDPGRLRLISAAAAIYRCRGEHDPTGSSRGDLAPRARTVQGLVHAARAVADAWAWVCVGGDPAAVAEALDKAWQDGPGGAYAGGLPTAVLRVRAYVAAGQPDQADEALVDLPDGTYDEAARAYLMAHAEALVVAAEDPRRASDLYAKAAEAMAQHLAEQPEHGLHLFQALLAEDHAAHLLRHGLTVTTAVRASLRSALGTVRSAGSRPWRTRLAGLVRQADAAGSASPPRALHIAASSEADQLEELTSREREISWLVADGLTNREIAAELFLSVRTVETHVARALRKLDCDSRVELRRILRTLSHAS